MSIRKPWPKLVHITRDINHLRHCAICVDNNIAGIHGIHEVFHRGITHRRQLFRGDNGLQLLGNLAFLALDGLDKLLDLIDLGWCGILHSFQFEELFQLMFAVRGIRLEGQET